MAKSNSKKKKKPSGWISPGSRSTSASPVEISSPPLVCSPSVNPAPVGSALDEAQSSISATTLMSGEAQVQVSQTLNPVNAIASAVPTTLPNQIEVLSIDAQTSPLVAPVNAPAKVVSPTDPNVSIPPTAANADVSADPGKRDSTEQPDWLRLFKGSSRPLSKKGKSFNLPSGEACVDIPDSVIEKHQKSWESFIIGQFYSDPPPQGTIHTIVNGIWSRQFRDVSVSKLEGNAFLFRIPNFQTRSRVINQRLWNIDGQTMFVANWEPGVVPVKPELSSAPIWLELRDVPLQFFNDDGLERIAGLVGDPKFLHPDTSKKTNLEVAKVFTIIDPRKQLPEAVNVRFQCGEIRRVKVSSPWMPPICSICKEVGHTPKRCRSAPVTCSGCNSSSHLLEVCPRVGKKKKQPQYKPKSVPPPHLPVSSPQPPLKIIKDLEPSSGVLSGPLPVVRSSAPRPPQLLQGESSGRKGTDVSSGVSAAEPDSSDTYSSDSVSSGDDRLEEEDYGFTEVLSKKQRRRERGSSLKIN